MISQPYQNDQENNIGINIYSRIFNINVKYSWAAPNKMENIQ